MSGDAYFKGAGAIYALWNLSTTYERAAHTLAAEPLVYPEFKIRQNRCALFHEKNVFECLTITDLLYNLSII